MELIKEFKASEYQKNILDCWHKFDDNIIVEALAGSGKTTTIKECIAQTNKNKPEIENIYLVFSKAMQVETASKFKKQKITADVCTTHSFAFRILQKTICKKLKIDNKKYLKKVKEQSEILFYEYDRNYLKSLSDNSCIYEYTTKQKMNNFLKNIWELVRGNAVLELRKNNDYFFFDYSNNFLRKIIKTYKSKFLDETSLDLVANLIIENQILEKLLDFGVKSACDEYIVDFTDMLFLNFCFKPNLVNKNTYLYVDEAQDLNKSQIELIKIINAKRVMFVGDSNQSIFGFRGSLPDSMDIIKLEFSCKVLPLSICYRCPQSVINVAKEYVKDIEPSQNAIIGNVFNLEIEKLPEIIKKGDLMMSRFYQPLIKIYLNLLKKGFEVKLKDVGDIFLKKLENMFNYIDYNLSKNTLTQIDEYRKYQISLIDEDEDEVKKVEDIVECWKYFYDDFMSLRYDKTKKDFLNYIKSKLKNNFKSPIILDTIHSCKGTEANNVFIIGYEDMPYEFKGNLNWQNKQEVNLTYVAVTRAKKNMYFIKTIK